MRILVAHNVSRQRTGGMSRIMGFIHDEIEAAGHQVDWLCAEDVPRGWRGPQGRFGFPWLVWRAARRAARRGHPYDVVNVHEPHGALAVLDQPRVSRRGVVVTSHGLEHRAWALALEEARLGREGPSGKTRIVYPVTSLWQSRLALTHARAVMVLSEEDRRFLTEQWSVPAARIARMRPGASLLYASRTEGRTYDTATRIVFAGTWRKNKGIEDLVPALITLWSRCPGLTLTVLGAGVESAVVTASFPPDVRARVSVVPSANDQAAADILAASDIFVLPSLFEGTPLTLIEAMMAGLPIVTTDTCGMRDTIADGINGLLVPRRSPAALADAVARLQFDRELRERLGRSARQAALERSTWPVVAREVLDTYRRVCGEER